MKTGLKIKIPGEKTGPEQRWMGKTEKNLAKIGIRDGETVMRPDRDSRWVSMAFKRKPKKNVLVCCVEAIERILFCMVRGFFSFPPRFAANVKCSTWTRPNVAPLIGEQR